MSRDALIADFQTERLPELSCLSSHSGQVQALREVLQSGKQSAQWGRVLCDLNTEKSERSTSRFVHKGWKDDFFLACQTSKLQETLWSQFPEELFERVLAHLPIASLFRFRIVCKSWNASLYSHSFLRLCSQIPPKGPWFYTITHENINSSATYDPQSNMWYHISLPIFPQKGIVLPVASAGGLVCFLDIGLQHFFVSNPLVRSCRELPSRKIKWWSRKAVGMVMVRDSKTYKLVWLDSSGDYEMYDSFDDSWKSGFMPHALKVPLGLNFRSQPVSIGGALYFMRSKPDGLVMFDTIKNNWEELRVPLPPGCLEGTLAECRGRILMVGLLLKDHVTCVCVWELQRMTWLWKEGDRMPKLMCLDFNGKQVRMTCLGNRSLVLLSLRCRQFNRLILYDLSKKLWHRVPSCFVPHSSKQQWIACGTSFEPSISAAV